MQADSIQFIKFIPNKEWIIGRSYNPNDNSYIASQIGQDAWLEGARSLVIISQPYTAKVFSEIRRILNLGAPEHQFVNVIDTFSGIRYCCLFNERFVSKAPARSIGVDKNDLISRRYSVKDNSYIKEVNSNGRVINDFHCPCIDMKSLVIASYPFEGKGEGVLGDEFDSHWIIAKDLTTKRFYRIPYNPGWVGEKVLRVNKTPEVTGVLLVL